MKKVVVEREEGDRKGGKDTLAARTARGTQLPGCRMRSHGERDSDNHRPLQDPSSQRLSDHADSQRRGVEEEGERQWQPVSRQEILSSKRGEVKLSVALAEQLKKKRLFSRSFGRRGSKKVGQEEGRLKKEKFLSSRTD